MNREEAITVAKNLLEKRKTLKHQTKTVDNKLKKLSEKFSLTLNLKESMVN